MRCEICNRSQTDIYVDGHGDIHDYCVDCIDDIEVTLSEFDEDEDEPWWADELAEEEFDEETYEQYQELEDTFPSDLYDFS